MPLIAIVTDTDASLPADLAARYDIRQVPINVQFGEENFETGVNIDDASLFARVDREGRLPTTSAPSPGQFSKAYEAAFDAGAEEIVCFCVSGEVSATYGAAVVAAELMPEGKVSVVDTRTLSMAQGFMALAAAEAVEGGASKDEAIAQAMAVGNRTHLYAALSTVKYLAMSGRVGQLAAGFATVLNVKPILTMQEGKLGLLERVRTQRKAWARVIDLTTQAIGDRSIERLAIIHVAVPDDARLFEEQIRARLPCPDESITSELTPGLSVHSGAGLVGAVVVTS
jgi:DegV family protein with EDD domain